MAGEIFALIIVFGFLFGVAVILPLTAMLLGHRRKLLEMRHRETGSDELRRRLESLERQVAEIRETAGEFILSQDATSEQLSRRLERMEGRLSLPPTETSEPVARLTDQTAGSSGRES